MITGDLLTFRDPEERDIGDIPAGWGAGFGASFEEGFHGSFGPMAFRFARRQFMDEPQDAGDVALRATLGTIPGLNMAPMTVEGNTPMLSPAEANEAFSIGDLKFNSPVSLERAMDLYETTRARMEREDVIRRSSVGMAGRFIAGLGGAALDPVNIAAGVLPSAVLARTGLAAGSSFTASTMGRRLAYAATEGFLGSAALAPGTYALAQMENRPYTVTDALLDVAFGTILTAGLHTTIGAFVDWRNTGRDMPVVSQAMENAPVETRMQVERGALANVMEGRPANVAAVVADEVGQYIARTMDAGIDRQAAREITPEILAEGRASMAQTIDLQDAAPAKFAEMIEGAAPAQPMAYIAVKDDADLLRILREDWKPEQAAEAKPVARAAEDAEAPYVVLSEPGRPLAETGPAAVVLNGASTANIERLREAFPDKTFLTPEQARAYVETGAKPEQPAVPVAQSERAPSPVMALPEARTATARENLTPYRDPADAAVSREADEAAQGAPVKARTDEQGIGAVTPETRELDAIAAEVEAEIASLKQTGALTKADEAALAEADELVKRAEVETKARDYAAICLSGVDITPRGTE